MVDYDERMGERIGYNPEREKRAEHADAWENANMLETAPDFQGDDFYNPTVIEERDDLVDEPTEAAENYDSPVKEQNKFNAGYDELGRPVDAEGYVIEKDEKKVAPDADRYETKRTVKRGYGGAENLTSYGLDTAAKVYGLSSVLKAISETDESGRDVMNPVGSIYTRLAPNPDARRYLYNEIQKQSIIEDTEDDVPGGMKLGFDENSGEFYAKNEARFDDQITTKDMLAQRETNVAVREMKKLLNELQYSDRFAKLREKAAKEGMDVISYITSGEVSPTISSLFDGLDMASGSSADEILDTIEQEEEIKEAEEEAKETEEANAQADGLGDIGGQTGLNPDLFR